MLVYSVEFTLNDAYNKTKEAVFTGSYGKRFLSVKKTYAVNRGNVSLRNDKIEIMTTKTYNLVSLIRKKRDKKNLTPDEIKYIIDQYSKDQVPDYQISAFLMACFLNGLNDEETAALTEAMLYSGQVLDLSEIPGVKVDKHSTGGVGDKLSLILAPIVAACGVPVPMISGRGLGHSGGTLDKLESIPGFTVSLDLDRYRSVLAKHNVVLIGQTEEIAPADKRLYALRDVTATVEAIPLIAGSIMSKKLAEGIDALVLDVKYGTGAFMKTQEEALRLAQKLVAIGTSFGKETIAYITNMEQPLGYKIGNWLEVEESIDGLKGEGPEDIMEVTHLLAGTMIYLGKKAESVEEGIAMSKESVANGTAFQKFIEITEEQHGDSSYLKNPSLYQKATVEFEIKAKTDGFITAMDAYAFGMAGIELGAGRRVKEDVIDPVAGITLAKKIGDSVRKGETIATCYTNREQVASMVTDMLEQAVHVGSEKPEIHPMITHRVDANGISEYKN